MAPEDDDEIWKRYKSATLLPLGFFLDADADLFDADADFFDADANLFDDNADLFDDDANLHDAIAVSLEGDVFDACDAFLNLKRESFVFALAAFSLIPLIRGLQRRGGMIFSG